MREKDYANLSDDEKIEILKREKFNTDDETEVKKLIIIRTLSSEELMMECAKYLKTDSARSALTNALSKIENKMKIIDTLTEEKWITSAAMELSELDEKVMLLERIKSRHYKSLVISTIKHNDLDIATATRYIKDENDKTAVILKIKKDEIKTILLHEIIDVNNKGRIVGTIKGDSLKLEYIDKVSDKGVKAFLIASLIDREERDNLLEISEKKYRRLLIPDNITIGMEIECEGKNSVDAYGIDNLLYGWNVKNDTSLQEGVEITTAVLTNKEEDTTDLYSICNILNEYELTVSERCGGHVHVGADHLKTKGAYKNLIELWANNEELMYLISNAKGELPREGTFEFSWPFSKKILDAINAGKFDETEEVSKDKFIEIIKKVQTENEKTLDRRSGINFLNINDIGRKDCNTVEFRLSNGTINPDIWIENASLYGGIIAISQKLDDIKQKQIEQRSKEEIELLEVFYKLRTKDVDDTERLELFLKLCVPEELHEVFMGRYEVNSKLYEQNKELKDKMSKKIANEPVILPIAEDFKPKMLKMVSQNGITFKAVSDVASELRGYIEQGDIEKQSENNERNEDATIK